MARLLSLLLFVALAFVLSTDALCCPDGCSDAGLAAQSSACCTICQRSVSPAVAASMIAPDPTPRPTVVPSVEFSPASPSTDIDHPPRA